MQYVVVCIRDRVADLYSIPNFTASIGQAMRGFTDEINRQDDKNIMYGHPEDFDLYEVGRYDDATGIAEWLPQPRQLCLGKEVKIRS